MNYILITGASSGIGRCSATYLAQKGLKIIAGVRKEEDFLALKEEHENITPIYLDVLKKESLSTAFETLKEKNIELSAIINNAGAVIAQPIEFINIDDLRYQFELNTIAPVAVAQTFLPLMKKGKIINLSSMASTGIFPFISPYCASKRALDILFNSLELEMQNKDIKVVSIKPGVIKTPIWNKSIDKNKEHLEKLPETFREKYGKTLLCLADNAQKNNFKGSEPISVAKTIYKVITIDNPKYSYCVGLDSLLVCDIAKLPHVLLNKLIMFNLKRKLK